MVKRVGDCVKPHRVAGAVAQLKQHVESFDIDHHTASRAET